jgi:selenide, water dikinase
VRGLPKFDDPNLLVGTEGFSDAGVYRLRDDLCIVQSLDFFPPLVDDPYVYGQIAAANSLSDVFTMGARPVTVMNIVGFPDDKLDLSILNEIMRGGAERVIAAGAVIVGGHTVRDVEIKFGLSVTGVVDPKNLLTNQNAQPGDALVLTKPLGTGFITTAFKAGRCSDDVLNSATDSMSQLNIIGRDAAMSCGGNAVTDITGFGFAGHAGEMAQSSDVTLVIETSRLPLLPGAKELAQQGNKTRASATNRSFSEDFTRIADSVDPLLQEFCFDAQTSGGLLISVPADRAEELVNSARENGAAATCVVGSVTKKQDASLLIEP